MTIVEPATTTTLTMSEAINRALREALDRPEPMMLIGQDIGPYGGTFGVTRGLSETYGEETIRDAPLCESGTVGYAIGLAITGVRAVVRDRVLRLRRRGDGPDLQPGREAPLLHRRQAAGAARDPDADRRRGWEWGPQHSQSLESWFMHIPGIKIVVPSNAADAYGLMRSALVDSNPVLFVENVRLYGRRAEVELDASPIPFGRARIAREGTRRHRRGPFGHGRRGPRGSGDGSRSAGSRSR